MELIDVDNNTATAFSGHIHPFSLHEGVSSVKMTNISYIGFWAIFTVQSLTVFGANSSAVPRRETF